jgi:predicted choloylglycine hydrolase
MQASFEAMEELEPGDKWAAHFARHWPRYEAWFMQEGEAARTSYAESLRALREHMPELVPTYERLCELTGGGDLEARFLAMWAPPSYLSGCSQGVLRAAGPVLARNYDYAPERLEGAILHTSWLRTVIGSSDCAWGLLDGINDAGLAVSLAFGGRKVIGGGFGVPLVVRYVLETCATTDEARAALRRLPHHLAHTLTVADVGGDVCTAFLAPDREVIVSDAVVATNHQRDIEWQEHAAATHTVEREECLVRLLERGTTTPEAFVAAFLRPPLYQQGYDRAMGTLYTAAYHLDERRVDFLWPGLTWPQSFEAFQEGRRTVTLVDASAAA